MDSVSLGITKTRIGQESVARIASMLSVRGYHVKSHLPYKSKFDLLVNGKRVEVKTAKIRNPGGNWEWKSNIHRHGKLDESQVDVYIFELTAHWLQRPVILVKPAPIEVLTISFTPWALMCGKYADYVYNWKLLEPIKENPSIDELRSAIYFEMNGAKR